MCPRFWPLAPPPPQGMDPWMRSHGMKADPPGYLASKYVCFLMSGWWDILHSSCLHVKLRSNSTNGTEVRMNKRTDENYIPLGINAGGIKTTEKRWQHRFPHYKSMGTFCCHGNQRFDPICPKTLCNHSPTLMMRHIKFDQHWPTGLRDI